MKFTHDPGLAADKTMEKIFFNIEKKGKKYDFIYNPYINSLYSTKLAKHFDAFTERIKSISHDINSHYYPVERNEIIPYVSAQNYKLVLNLTENCNLECKYCPLQKKDKRADKKLIDDALAFYKFLKIKNSTNDFEIGFYGGEPLLEKGLIIYAVEQAKKIFYRKSNLFFRVTTNGTVNVDPDFFDFLKCHKVFVSLSLDGPEEEHDKFRVMKNGGGSFKKAMKVFDILKDYPHFMILITIHPGHDLEKIDRFFSDLKCKYPLVNFSVKFANLSHMDDRKLKEKKNKKITNLQNRIVYKLEENQQLSFTEGHYLADMKREYSFEFKNYWLCEDFCNSCFPGGKKLFVGIDGSLGICEKVGGDFNLGNIYDGLNEERFFEHWQLLQKMAEEFDCRNCAFHPLCIKCFASLGRNDAGDFSIRCNKERKEHLLNTLIFLAKIGGKV